MHTVLECLLFCTEYYERLELCIRSNVSSTYKIDFSTIVMTITMICFRWSKRSGHNKAQILYYIAENFELRKSEYIGRLVKNKSSSLKIAEREVNEAIERLFHWAAYADKYGGNVQVRPSSFSLKSYFVQE